MTTVVAPDRATRYEVWDDLPTAGGARVDFIPRADVVRCVTPATTDTTARAELELVPTARTLAAVQPGRVLRLPEWQPDGTTRGVEYWRILADTLSLGAGQRALRVSAEHPLLDWGAAGRMRTTSGAGLTSFELSGSYTPAEALDLCLDWLTARGRTGWAAGTIDRTDRRPLTIQGLTALEGLRLIERTWALEAAIAIAGDESEIAVSLLNRVGETAAVPVLRYGPSGALVRLERTRDATEQAGAVLPLGADGATIGLVPWRVTAAETVTDWVELQDRRGGPGPIQVDGQLVGAYLQRMDGTREAIVDSEVNDGVTSRVRVADATGFSAATHGGWGDDVEFRADSAGTRLVALEDPDADAATLAEVPLERTDLDVARNYVPNARGEEYATADALPDGWAYFGDPATGGRPGDRPAIARLALPAGYPSDVSLDGNGWRAWIGYDLSGVDLPLSFAVDPVSGDAAISYGVWVYVDATLSYTSPSTYGVGFRVQLIDGTGATVTGSTADTWSYQTWLAPFGVEGLTLAALKQLKIRLTFAPGSAGQTPNSLSERLPVYVAGAQITRTATPQAYLDGSRAPVLWQAANAHLAGHRAAVESLAATATDRAVLDPTRYGDRPLVPGGDVRCVVSDLGLDLQRRLVGWQRERKAPGPVPLTLVTAPADAQVAATAPTRPQTLAELLAAR